MTTEQDVIQFLRAKCGELSERFKSVRVTASISVCIEEEGDGYIAAYAHAHDQVGADRTFDEAVERLAKRIANLPNEARVKREKAAKLLAEAAALEAAK